MEYRKLIRLLISAGLFALMITGCKSTMAMITEQNAIVHSAYNYPDGGKAVVVGNVTDINTLEPVRHSIELIKDQLLVLDFKLYTGVGCPFCPIVKRRLTDLQHKMGFELKEIDVTLKPEVIIGKGIRALPVIEVGESQWIGNATSDQLVTFITKNGQEA